MTRHILSKTVLFTAGCILMGSANLALAREPAQVNYQVLLLRQKMTIQKNGAYTDSIDRVIQPLTMAGVQSQSQVKIGYPANFAQVHILEAYTETPSGSKYPVPANAIYTQSSPDALNAPFLSDGRIQSVVFPAVAPGDTLHIRYTIHYDHGYLPGIHAISTVLAPNVPVKQAQIILHAPASQKLYATRQGSAWQPGPVQKDKKGISQSFTTSLKNVSYPPLGSPALTQYAPQAVISTTAKWTTVAQAYDQLAAPALQITPELQKVAARITAGATGMDAVKAIYHWMQKNIHSVSINYANAGFTPPSASSTLQRGVGDSNANAVLLCALLRAVHVEAVPALISTSARFHPYPGVDPLAFGHFLAYIPAYDLFLDPTSRYAGIHSLPLEDAGRPVLITGKDPRMTHTPAPDLSLPLIDKHTRLTLSAAGQMLDQTTELRRGYAAQDIRSALIGSQGRLLMKGLRNGFYEQGDLGKLESIAFQNRKNLDRPLGIKIRAIKDGLFIPGPSMAMIMPTDTAMAKPLQAFTAEAERSTPSLINPSYMQSHISLKLPQGYQPAYLPKNVDVQTAIGGYAIHYALHGQTLHIDQRLKLPEFVISAKDYPDLHRLALLSSSSTREGLLLVKDKPKR
ncbi:DUF3857 domain-containing protein [Acidithiobacillus sp. M4-SHS-6]|uniref:DUF3857 domain-containing protein n=1 Tax=Acidithiobacillus sp. M4-SHS-6 TaxID=3383024 RepID=UPI0039BE234E